MILHHNRVTVRALFEIMIYIMFLEQNFNNNHLIIIIIFLTIQINVIEQSFL